MSEPQIDPNLQAPVGLLLSRDLIFTSKVTGTASALGHRMLVAGSPSLASDLIARHKLTVVFVDLAAGNLVEPAQLVQFLELARPGTPFLAFGSHVDTQALADAAAAGCDPVMPRSRFSNELPSLIRRYFGEG